MTLKPFFENTIQKIYNKNTVICKLMVTVISTGGEKLHLPATGDQIFRVGEQILFGIILKIQAVSGILQVEVSKLKDTNGSTVTECL